MSIKATPAAWTEKIQAGHQNSNRGLKPDLQIVLSLSRQEALDRMEKDGKKKDRIESRNEEFQRKVVKGYEEISDSEPNTIKIDGDRPR